jgi:putative hemolysin
MADVPILPERPEGAMAAPPASGTLGRLGDLEVRLARTPAELDRAQEIRYQVFYEEMSAVADAGTRASRRDRDEFDAHCDHMLVFDHARKGADGGPEIVGTYRLLRQEVAIASGCGFYTAREFDLAPMLARHPGRNFLELGRSCVLKPYRTKRTVELLWHGNWTFVRQHDLDVMFGCASLEGTDVEQLAPLLRFLRNAAPAPEEWRVAAQPGQGISLDNLPASDISPDAAVRALPPLVKGYLRLGGVVGEDAVIDAQFGTTDIVIVLPVERLNPRYVNYYGAEATRYAA